MTLEEFNHKAARIVIAIQKAGCDHLGDVSSIHQDFQDLLKLAVKQLGKKEEL